MRNSLCLMFLVQDSACEIDADSMPDALNEVFAVAEREQRADSATRIGAWLGPCFMGFYASTMGDWTHAYSIVK